MKKKINIVIIVVASIVLLCTILCFIDFNNLMLDRKPVFVVHHIPHFENTKLITEEYYGLGYKLVKCYVTCDEKVKIMPLYLGTYAWFIEHTADNYVIIDETEACDSALEEIARDEQYIYYFSCIKSATVFLQYDDGQKITVKSALEQNLVTIYELLDKGLQVIKEPY